MYRQAFMMALEPRCRSLSPTLNSKPTEMTIFVYANSKSTAVRIELTKFDLLAYNPTLDRIAQRVGMRKEGIKSLYTVHGQRIYGSQQLVNRGAYVGVSGTDRFRKMAYNDHDGFNREKVLHKKTPAKVKSKTLKDSLPTICENTHSNDVCVSQGCFRSRPERQLNNAHDFRKNYRRITGNSLDTLGPTRLSMKISRREPSIILYEPDPVVATNIDQKNFPIPFYQDTPQPSRRKQSTSFKYTVKHDPGSQEKLASLQSKGVPYYSNVHPIMSDTRVSFTPLNPLEDNQYDIVDNETEKRSSIFNYTVKSDPEMKCKKKFKSERRQYSPFDKPWSAMTDVPEETSETVIENPCSKQSYYSMISDRPKETTDSDSGDEGSMMKFLQLND